MTDVGSYGDVERRAPPPIVVPGNIDDRMRRGRAAMKRDASKRRLCIRFTRGDQFWWIDERGRMQFTPTTTFVGGGGKPPHKSRNTYNFIGPVIEDKVSNATKRIPAYEIDPATPDPEDQGAASLAEKAAIYGYDQWRVRKAAVDTVKNALGNGGAGYAMPYFEPNVGPYTRVDGEWVGQGEIRILTLNGNQVYWEEGVNFEESRWWVVERARPIYEIKEIPGYAGGEIVPDATTADLPTDRTSTQNIAIVSEYFERPCPKWPRGRALTIANSRVIVDQRRIDPTTEYVWGDYPVREADGTVVDEPLLHRLVYTHDPDADNDFGLTWQLIDFQRTLSDTLNKIVEYKNRGLNLQMKAPVNTLIDRPDDVPNSVRYYKLSPNGEQPEWEKGPDPSILNALIQIFNTVLNQMHQVAAYEDVQADPNVAARTTQAVIEQSLARWQTFLGDLAEWHSRLMRHCLLLMSRFYSEPRTLLVRGRMGWESIKDFRGAHLMGQTNVRVFPGSLEYLTRAQVLAKTQYYAQMQWITGEQAMAAIEGAQVEKLTEGYDQDAAKVNRIINRIRDGTVIEMPTRTEFIEVAVPPDPMTGQVPVDPATGQPQTQKVPEEVPVWMPNDWDNVKVWRQQLGLWMKTQDFEALGELHPDRAEVAKLMWAGLEKVDERKALQAAQRQQQMAASLGMGNAAAPQGPPTPPSLPNAAGMPSPQGNGSEPQQ